MRVHKQMFGNKIFLLQNEWCIQMLHHFPHTVVTGPAKINHVSANNRQFFHLHSYHNI